MKTSLAGLLVLPVFLACSGSSGSGGNRAPTVTIDAPFPGSSFDQGSEVQLEGTASDSEEGALTGASLSWSSDLDGVLGNGASLTLSTLALGTHRIRLDATDSAGATGSASVTIRIATRAAQAPRAGEVNPYAGRLQRTPQKLDDELILVARSTAQDQLLFGILDTPVHQYGSEPSSTPLEPRISARRDGAIPLAAAAGRVLGSNWHQAALVSRSGAGADLRLEVTGLVDPGTELHAEYAFLPLFPSGALDVAVADLDAFEEHTGAQALLGPPGVNADYHDEAVLACADLLNGELVARIEVLSFEDLDFRLDEGLPVPAPTSVTTTWTSVPMHPASRVVVRHGEQLFTNRSGPHLVVAYVDALKRIALDVFEYEHTRADPGNPDPRGDGRALLHVLHTPISTPLADSTLAAGGWDVVVGRSERLGMSLVGDVVLAVHNTGGNYLQQAWRMQGLDGLGGPVSLGQESGEFARVTNGLGGEIGLRILADSRLRLALGRIVDTVANRCEALGLFVLADTNRGPVVQSMTAFIDDPFVGNERFGPVDETPAWPSVAALRNHPETSQTSKVSLVAGGFVSLRNGLIDARGNPSGIGNEFAQDCSGVNSAPMLGPMPSFYVADPTASALHAVSMLLGAEGGLTVSVPLDAAIDEAPLLLAADATGDAAYYRTLACAGTGAGDCRRLFLGDAELHYVIEDIETSNVLLQQPPKHVDYLRALGGIVDVSMRDGFYAQFVQSDQASGSVQRRTKTDWSIGARGELGLGPSVPKEKDFSSSFEASLDAEHRSVQEQFSSSQVAVSLTQTTGAVDDDVVWSKRQTIDYWRFPAQGGKPTNDPAAESGFPDDAYLEVAIPAEPSTQIGPGTLNDAYQPTHMVGNILSYPIFSGGVDDLGELFDFLGSYVPSDENGTRQCKPREDGDLNGCLILVNGVLQRVAQVLAGDDFVGGEFQSISNPIDVAEILQVGGISYSAELEFETSVKNGLTVTNNDTIKAEANLKLPLDATGVKGPVQFGEVKLQVRASASFENARVSENSIGSKAKVALHLPADIPVERSYLIRPSFGFTPGGGLRVSYQVNTDGAAATFWERHYGGPDPALHMPHRIVRTREGFRLGTDFSRDRIKGFFVRAGEGVDPLQPGAIRGELLTEVPRAGDPLQLEVQVSNLSVATAVSDLAVLFSVQLYADGDLVGAEVPIGVATIDYLPHRGQFLDQPSGHVQSAFLVWDTTGFGPVDQTLVTYRVRVTLDPDDRVRNETHELLDRHQDPLLGPLGEVLDARLEKGQNNSGWALLRLAPALADAALGADARGSRVAGHEVVLGQAADTVRARGAVRHGRVDEPLQLALELRSARPVRDHGLLQVFDGDPAGGGLLILSRVVQGLAAGTTREEFVWRPRTSGRRLLHAVYVGSGAPGGATLQIPVRIAD